MRRGSTAFIVELSGGTPESTLDSLYSLKLQRMSLHLKNKWPNRIKIKIKVLKDDFKRMKYIIIVFPFLYHF